ncbi:MAG: hypothetical protein AAFU79_34880, partial [Myxococcota bacterium]
MLLSTHLTQRVLGGHDAIGDRSSHALKLTLKGRPVEIHGVSEGWSSRYPVRSVLVRDGDLSHRQGLSVFSLVVWRPLEHADFDRNIRRGKLLAEPPQTAVS